MEMLIAIPIVLLAAGGLALGLAFGRGPIRGSCGGAACSAGCAGCPRRRKADEDGAS
ncbi:MAG: hypothetical protein ACU0DK_13550 [Pseudooceanicola sp.]